MHGVYQNMGGRVIAGRLSWDNISAWEVGITVVYDGRVDIERIRMYVNVKCMSA